MEYQILQPIDRQPRRDVALQDLQEPEWRMELIPPSAEVIAYETQLAEQQAFNDAHTEALAEDALRHETYRGRHTARVGMVGEFALRLHPDVTNLHEAAEVQRNYEARTESAGAFMAGIAIESVAMRWQESRRHGFVGRVAHMATRAREAVLPATRPQAARGVAQVPRFSHDDLGFLANLRQHYLSIDHEFGTTRVA